LSSTAHAASERSRTLQADALIINGLGSLLRPPGLEGEPFVLPEIMSEGGVTAVNYTVAVTEDFPETARLMAGLLAAIDRSRSPRARVALSSDDLREAKALGEVAIILGFQGSEPLSGSFANLELFYRLGLRILQLTYQRRNLAGDGCGEPADAGLSLFGRELVGHCNRLGILIDLSHTGYKSTMETIELSSAPVAFTHVNMHALNAIPRNKTDEQIRFLAERGGIVGINAIARLLSPQGRDRGASVSEFVDQIEHVNQLVGIDHVSIGLDVVEDMTEDDFELRNQTFFASFPELKAGGSFPFENYYVRDLSMRRILPLIDELVERGYSDQDIKKILGENLLRVYEQAWQQQALVP
jgi:membrane dipeptidase